MAKDRGYEAPAVWNCCGIDYHLFAVLKVCSYPSPPILLTPTYCFFLFSLVLPSPSPFLKCSLPSLFSPSNFITNLPSPSLHTLPHFQKERLWNSHAVCCYHTVHASLSTPQTHTYYLSYLKRLHISEAGTVCCLNCAGSITASPQAFRLCGDILILITCTTYYIIHDHKWQRSIKCSLIKAQNRVKIIALLLSPFSWYLDQTDKGFWLL